MDSTESMESAGLFFMSGIVEMNSLRVKYLNNHIPILFIYALQRRGAKQ
jgi:hypothetical protein